MKVVTCEIAWHNKEPVYSLDFQHGCDGRVHRLATAGVDTAVRVSDSRIYSHLMCVNEPIIYNGKSLYEDNFASWLLSGEYGFLSLLLFIITDLWGEIAFLIWSGDFSSPVGV